MTRLRWIALAVGVGAVLGLLIFAPGALETYRWNHATIRCGVIRGLRRTRTSPWLALSVYDDAGNMRSFYYVGELASRLHSIYWPGDGIAWREYGATVWQPHDRGGVWQDDPKCGKAAGRYILADPLRFRLWLERRSQQMR